MLKSGFVKIQREFTTWRWYEDDKTKSVFLHLLLTANYEDKEWRGIIVKRGSRVASYHKIADELGMTEKSVRVAINHLIASNDVSANSTNQYTVFSVVCYDDFQNSGRQKGKRGASEGKTKGKRGATMEESIKNINKKDKECSFASASIDWSLPRDEIVKLIDWDNLDKYSDDDRIRIARL